MAGKPTPMGDPREWLRKKLGEADFAEFEKGMRKAAEAKGAGKAADVAGQGTCYAACNSFCISPGQSVGAWSRFFPYY